MSQPVVAPIASPVAGVGEHKHCEVCGKSIGTDGRMCSKECQDKWAGLVKLRKRNTLVIVGLLVLILTSGYWLPLVFGTKAT